MKNYFLILLLIPAFAFSQEEQSKRFVHAGILCGDISLAPGLLLQENISTVSIPGTLEYYIDEHVSIKSDVYFHVSSGLTSDSLRLTSNHQLFTGIAYHFKTNGNLDPYMAFQPGLAYTQLTRENKLPNADQTPYGTLSYSPAINPIVGIALGVNYYFPRYFHIFIEMRYVHGTHLYDVPVSFPLDEVKYQFGLGFNINTKH